MSTEARSAAAAIGAEEQLRYAREVIRLEGQALVELAGRLDERFAAAADLVFRCCGSVMVSGMGKAGLIGQKLAATLASTGTRSHFLHPAEAVHGDLGRVHWSDVVLALSKSGQTEELVRLLPTLQRLRVPIIAITSNGQSPLARAATVVLELGPLQEACSLGLAPSTSTTAMLALGDGLALVVSRMRNFGQEDFYAFHPAGNLGRQLARVEECMRPLQECRVARDADCVRDVFVAHSRPGRRSGAIMLTGADGRLSGLFTDSDLARLFESRRDEALDAPIRLVMTAHPRTVQRGSMMADAVEIMAERKISELPVVDEAGRPLGLIDITDVVGMIPDEPPAAGHAAPPKPKMLLKSRSASHPPSPRPSPRGRGS
jgi:arabinose-5-phosphate isomerase